MANKRSSKSLAVLQYMTDFSIAYIILNTSHLRLGIFVMTDFQHVIKVILTQNQSKVDKNQSYAAIEPIK